MRYLNKLEKAYSTLTRFAQWNADKNKLSTSQLAMIDEVRKLIAEAHSEAERIESTRGMEDMEIAYKVSKDTEYLRKAVRLLQCLGVHQEVFNHLHAETLEWVYDNKEDIRKLSLRSIIIINRFFSDCRILGLSYYPKDKKDMIEKSELLTEYFNNARQIARDYGICANAKLETRA